MKMKLLLLLTMVSCDDTYKEHFMDIVLALKEHFHSGCVYVIYDEDIGLQDHEIALKSTKRICMPSIRTLSSSKIYDLIASSNCYKNRPIFIMMHQENKTTNLLQKLVSTVDLSQVVWVVFLDNALEVDELLRGVDIRFDCEFLVVRPADGVFVLTEVYHVSLALRTNHFGNWTIEEGLARPRIDFYQRRNSLQGLVLKTGTTNIYGGILKITKEINGKPQQVGEYFGDVWNVLEKTLRFRSDYYKPRDNVFGADQGNGSWDGLMGMVLRDEVHVVNAALLMTQERSSAVDFISPFAKQRLCLYIRRPKTTELVWDSFLKPFSSGIWTVLLLSVGMFTTAFAVTSNLWHRCGLKKERHEVRYNLLQSLMCSFSAFCQQGQERTPNLMPSRVIYLSTYLTAVVVLTSYSASLISYIMTDVYRLPFTNFQEFLNDGTYQLGVLFDSASLMYFKMANNSMLNEIYRRHILPYESNLPKTISEALQKVCVNEKFTIVMYEIVVAAFSNQLNCTLVKIPDTFVDGSLAMVIQKKSPYRRILKLTTNNMARSGLFNAIQERYAPNPEMQIENEFSSVSLGEVTPILVVLGTGVVAAIFVIALELLWHWKKFRCIAASRHYLYRK